ncbi:MAG: bifunctional (p)ppGpp synthetase/guanosine-3',5'-bis(diphosphate) 3'-pyrophosphohydrolase [Gammaproteobacteria bacterium]|nr:bifunctional (p)ppGpp synthetase/guanosine-3',5'-bis(diphosphate) 3'-pyrophosphohydrolase [Gammaproteobacteria bacterium]
MTGQALAVQQTPEPDVLYQDLRNYLKSYLKPIDLEMIDGAYACALDAHSEQTRISGEPYICHPVAVAKILAEMEMDKDTIAAALLHDVVEDTHVSRKQLVSQFGVSVADLVDGVTKLDGLPNYSKAETQAENVRKMVLAMSKDLRIIVLKLADRCHNMRTLSCLPLEKRRRIARETLEIYAPIAHRLSMNKIRHELENIGFQTLYPMRYRILKEAAQKAHGSHQEVLIALIQCIEQRLSANGLNCNVVGREKIPHSIYQKMRKGHIPFSEVFDVLGIRIVTDTVDECYRALGLVHGLYQPLPGYFKDYIALPKKNGYQSLHTIVLAGEYECRVEVQIRTRSMHRLAESGIAAHWNYKSEADSSRHSKTRANEWLQNILEIQKSAADSLEFLEHLKVDLFPDETYVFTPQGEIIKLPRGSTVIDFAYAVHTDIGNTCLSARIDKRLVPLQTVLYTGQTVEIITSSEACPVPPWLNYVVTARARAAIRAYLRDQKQDDAIQFGRRLLERELQKFGMKLDQINESTITTFLESMKYETLNDYLAAIGLGDRSAFIAANWLCQSDGEGMKLNVDEHSPSTVVIKGTEGMIVNLAKCCHPIPGDHIIGLFHRNKGIVVHLSNCKNALEARSHRAGWIDVEWDSLKEDDKEFPVELILSVRNRKGTLSQISTIISRLGCNIEHVNVETQDLELSRNTFIVTVKDRQHLAQLIRKLYRLQSVVKIRRRVG